MVHMLDGGSGYVWSGNTHRSNGEKFNMNNITTTRALTLRLDGDNRWGTHWMIGSITPGNPNSAVSNTPKTFIDLLEPDDLVFEPTGDEVIVNMPARGSAAAVGGTHTVTAYDDAWKATVNDLQYYGTDEEGKYYTYRYKVQEISIIDAEEKEIEFITNTEDGTEGESLHFTVAYDNSPAGTVSSPLKITNTRREELTLILKKVDVRNLEKPDLSDDDLLPGARFRIEKYKTIDPLNKDLEWNLIDGHDEENEGENGTFTFSGLVPGYYMIQETAYPAGYISISENPLIRVNEDLSIQLLDAEGNEIANNQTDTVLVKENTTTLIFGNTPGNMLPATGGPGIIGYLISGGLLALAAGWLLLKKH